MKTVWTVGFQAPAEAVFRHQGKAHISFKPDKAVSMIWGGLFVGALTLIAVPFRV